MLGLRVIIGVLFCIGCVLADDSTTVKVKSQGGKVYAILGSAVSLECYVENRPEAAPGGTRPKLRWEFQGQDGDKSWIELSSDANPEDRNRYSVKEEDAEQRYTIKINTVQMEDQGIYQCKIQTQSETFVLDSAKLVVRDRPVISKVDSTKSQTKHVGEKGVVFRCVANGIPKPVITWIKTGAREAQAFRPGVTKNDSTSELMFDEIKPEDRGYYVCRAKNAVGSASWEVRLGVTFPPVIKPSNDKPVVSQAIGYEAFLVCEVEANPRPDEAQSSWTFNGMKITATSKEESKGRPYTTFIRKPEGATMKLTIPRVTDADFSITKSGNEASVGSSGKDYICEASNQHGSYQAKLQLQEADVPQKTRAGEANAATQAYISVATIFSLVCAVFL